jgi:hypothetical protein
LAEKSRFGDKTMTNVTSRKKIAPPFSLTRPNRSESPLSLEFNGELSLTVKHRDGTIHSYVVPLKINPQISIDKVLRFFEKEGRLVEVDYPNGLIWMEE